MQLTGVAPSGNVLPEAGAQVTLGEGSPLSVALGAVYVTTVPAGLVASVEKDEGMPTSTGLVVSVTVIVNDAWLELLLASVAVQVTVFEPRAKLLPDAGEQPTVGLGSTLSVAVGEV